MDSESFGAWTRYFNEISRYIEDAERQYGIANANFCEYIFKETWSLYWYLFRSLWSYGGISSFVILPTGMQSHSMWNQTKLGAITVVCLYWTLGAPFCEQHLVLDTDIWIFPPSCQQRLHTPTIYDAQISNIQLSPLGLTYTQLFITWRSPTHHMITKIWASINTNFKSP